MFNWLDYLIIVFVLSGLVFGVSQGYKWQLYRFGCVLCAFLLALVLANFSSKFINTFHPTDNAMFWGYFSIFLGFLLVTLVGGILVFGMNFKTPNIDTDKMLGLILGLIKNAVLCSVIITSLWIFGVDGHKQAIDKSRIASTMRTETIHFIPFINKLSDKA